MPIKIRAGNVLKRLIAVVIVVMTLITSLSVNAFAGDSVFLETLINTDKCIYVANLVSDTANKGKKYAYKYVNMYMLCDNMSTNNEAGSFINSLDVQTNPNLSFLLNKTVYYREHVEIGQDVWETLEEASKESGVGDDIVDFTHSLMRRWNRKSVPLSFPGHYTATVNNEQSEYAQETLTTLVASLNNIVTEVNGRQKYSNVQNLIDASILIRPEDENNIVVFEPKENYSGYVIIYADLTNITNDSIVNESSLGAINQRLKALDKEETTRYDSIYDYKNHKTVKSSSELLDKLGLPRASTNNALVCYVIPLKSITVNHTNGGVEDHVISLDFSKASFFEYAIPKGYTDITYGNEKKDADGKSTGIGDNTFVSAKFLEGGQPYSYLEKYSDTPWITIHMISAYANLVYKYHDLSLSTYVEPNTNVISELIAGLFNTIIWGIRSLLGLTEIETLIFNLGSRGSAAHNFGLMSDGWWGVVLQYQLVFQAIAWVILIIAFIKTLIDLNLSTINPQKRMSLYETIEKFIVAGIGLVILIPMVQFCLECNDSLVDLFASQIETSSLNMPVVNNILVQILVSIMWIIIVLYINFLYIYRSIIVALLIASGPFFIATMAFSKGGRTSLFVSWAKELLANIFVQAVHAFVLSFLVQLMTAGTALETFAIAISIIPITETFRSLIFAGAGGSTSQLANTATSFTQKAGAGLVKGGLGLASDAIAKKDGGGGGEGGSGGSGGSGKHGGTRENLGRSMANRIERMKNGTSTGAKIREKSAMKNGGKASGLAKFGAGLADYGQLVGMGAMSMMDTMADMTEALADVQLKSDASSVGRVVENATRAHGNNIMGKFEASKHGKQEAANRQASSSSQNATNISDANRMGGTAMDMNTGKTTMGGRAVGQNLSKNGKSVYVDSGETKNAHDLSDHDENEAFSIWSAADASTEMDVAIKNNDGTITKGKTREVQCANGSKSSVFMSNDTLQKKDDYAMRYVTPKQPGSLDNNVIVGKKITLSNCDGSDQQKIRAYNIKMNGTDAAVFDENGDSMTVKQLDGEYMNCDDNANNIDANAYKTAISDVIKDSHGDGLQVSQETGDFKKYIANQIDPKTDSLPKEYDFTKETMSGSDITNAAMISLLGEEKGNGVYEYSGSKFTTGMSQDVARQILHSRGIDGVREDAKKAVVYTQRTAPSNANVSSGLSINRGAQGNLITSHKYDFPKHNGSINGNTITYKTANDAILHMESTGHAAIAQSIKDHDDSPSSVQGFGLFRFNKGENGEFSMSLDPKAIKMNQVQVSAINNGSGLAVSSMDGRAYDIFSDDYIQTVNNDNPQEYFEQGTIINKSGQTQ